MEFSNAQSKPFRRPFARKTFPELRALENMKFHENQLPKKTLPKQGLENIKFLCYQFFIRYLRG
jgi:hypothetical protein